MLPRLRDRLKLGRSTLEVSPFCVGILPAEGADTISAAYDAGINFFFLTADMHWPLYEGTRRGLADLLRRRGGVRDDIVVVVVTYVAQREFLMMPFMEVVESVPGLDRVDVVTVGGCYADDPPARIERMAQHRAQGFLGCRAIGASFHDRATVAKVCNEEQVDIAFTRYNAGHLGAREEIFEHLSGSRTLLYGFKSMSGWVSDDVLDAIPSLPRDVWRPRPQDHYRFVLGRTPLDGLLCAPQSPAEVQALAEAMAEGPLDEDEADHLVDLTLLAEGRAELLPEAADDDERQDDAAT